MKIIQTFWTKNTPTEDLIRISAGWLSPEYHWMSWTLSCLQLRKYFGKVDLATDLNGRHILTEVLQLPFENVSTDLQKSLSDYHPQLWALAKLRTYSVQTEPFLHFDSDFFLQRPLRDTILNAPIVCQNLEKNLFFYRDTILEINKHLHYVPEPCLPASIEKEDIFSCNAGTIGGHDLNFFKEYTDYVFEFINRNKEFSAFQNPANLNFVFEQYFLHWLARKRDKRIEFVSPILQEDPSYATHANFNNLPNADFIHPVGGHKKNPELCAHVANILQLDYPEYYDRIMKVVSHEKIPGRIRVYFSKQRKLIQCDDIQLKDTVHFPRTVSALNYLETISPIKIGFGEEIDKLSTPGFIPEVNDKLRDLKGNLSLLKLLRQLYRLESSKVRLEKKSFGREEVIAKELKREMQSYKTVRTVYANSTDEILKTIVRINKCVKVIPISRNWICKIPELTDQMIKDKFEEKVPSDAELVLVPKFSRLYVEEYYLETLDSLLIEASKKDITIEHLAKHMEQYFSADMITREHSKFIDLMVNTIKRLSYIGILLLKEKKLSN